MTLHVGGNEANANVGVDGKVEHETTAPVVRRGSGEPAGAARVSIPIGAGAQSAEVTIRGADANARTRWIDPDGSTRGEGGDFLTIPVPLSPGRHELIIWVERDVTDLPPSLETTARVTAEVFLTYQSDFRPY